MKLKRFIFLFIVALLIAGPTIILIARLEGKQPSILINLPQPFLGSDTTFSVQIADQETGIRDSLISLIVDGKEIMLDHQSFPYRNLFSGGKFYQRTMEIKVRPKSLGIEDGKAIIRVAAQDYSWRNWGAGNKLIKETEVLIDTQAPNLEVISREQNIAQGGAGMLVYRTSEECSQSGVMVDNYLYPGYSGYFDDPLIHIAFFALAYDQGPGTQLYLSAIDLAGNQGRTGFVHHINKRVFKKDLVYISDNFLNMTIPKFEQEIDGSDLSPVEKFIQINSEMRKENANRIYEVTGQSDSNLYWNGSFLRLPRSAGRAGFGDHRSYYYENRQIDQQIHLGVDLASNAKSPVPAANAGKVVFTEKLGIYGLTVIVDHGFGLFSLYSHLSQVKVFLGQVLNKGQSVGDTGTTGLALGDHLHFSMLVHKTFVNPIEWWDAKWIENNISTKLSRE